MRRIIPFVLTAIVIRMFVHFAGQWIAEPAAAADDGRVFEMRTYYAAPGKFDALHARFRDHTIRLFNKHGLTSVGYWVPQDDGPQRLVYILSFPSKAAADKAWAEFRDDPEWKKVAADSQKDGALTTKIESVFMRATDYSQIK